MILSWITKEGKASMGKLDDALEQKLIEFCINHSVKPLNLIELKQYSPIQVHEIEQPKQTQNVNLSVLNQQKRKWWKR